MNTAQTISRKLLNYAKQHNINHQLVLIRFFHERLLYRVGQSAYRNRLILKGGNLIYSMQKEIARPTVDIDFSGRNMENDVNKIKAVFEIITKVDGKDAVSFDSNDIVGESINEHHQYNGVRIKIPCGLGNIKQNIQIDISLFL